MLVEAECHLNRELLQDKYNCIINKEKITKITSLQLRVKYNSLGRMAKNQGEDSKRSSTPTRKLNVGLEHTQFESEECE